MLKYHELGQGYGGEGCVTKVVMVGCTSLQRGVGECVTQTHHHCMSAVSKVFAKVRLSELSESLGVPPTGPTPPGPGPDADAPAIVPGLVVPASVSSRAALWAQRAWMAATA